ncbi:MAG: TauD/TfdA dioxygenase family protein [Gammaproteobacteria bacterium]
MALTFHPLHPLFVAEVDPLDLVTTDDPAVLAEIRHGMHRFGVLVFRDQRFDDASQLAFAERLDGTLHAKTGSAALGGNRFGNEALADISNLDERGEILPADDRRRQYGLANRLWHTDASFVEPAGRYSLLSARTVPAAGADTEFADMRAAYDDLPADMQARIAPLHAHHSIAYSRQVLGFEFSADEAERLKGVVQPLVRVNPVTGRKSLYLASHASRIVDWPVPDGRLLLQDLMEHATQPKYVYRHVWRAGDLVIWDNLATMHRARPFADTTQRRDLRRVTTLNLPHATA